MSWATSIINKLKNNETVSFRPYGTSMQPLIQSGQLCTCQPIVDHSSLQVNDIVICHVNKNDYLHLIYQIKKGQFQIGNNRGYINGWVGPENIYGLLIKVED